MSSFNMELKYTHSNDEIVLASKLNLVDLFVFENCEN